MIDTKELLKLIEEEGLDEVKSPSQNVSTSKKTNKENLDVLRFIRKTGLAPGENRVPTYVIYYHYILYTKPLIFTKKWGKEEFFRTFKKHFKQKRSGRQRFYMINDALNLSEELYQKALKYDQRYQKRT